MAQATASRRSATERRARPWPWPLARKVAYSRGFLGRAARRCAPNGRRRYAANVRRLAHQHDLALSRSLRDRRHARQTAQCVIISALQSVLSFCEQRGEDNSSDAPQGSQDRHVALLFSLPLRIVLSTRELFVETIDFAIGLADLAGGWTSAAPSPRPTRSTGIARTSSRARGVFCLGTPCGRLA
jgi:hypothetical protein